jgi:hypothetical protein
MSRRMHPRAWISAFVAAYLVLLFPACWSGAQIRAKQLGLAGPSSSNNNEEREEHEQHEVAIRDAQGQRPPEPPAAVELPPQRLHTMHVPRLGTSVATSPEPSVFSVKRLL